MSAVRKMKAATMKMARVTGRYADWRPGENEAHQADAVIFRGDIPPMAGREMNQYRLVLDKPRRLITTAQNVTYTERGMSWVGGRLERRYSFQEIGPRHVWEKPGPTTNVYLRASILQSQTPCTYGDWVSEHLAALALVLAQGALVEPLLLPSWWLDKPYVRRDLAVLGVTAEAVRSPVEIQSATVINKTRVGHYWNSSEALAVVSAMKIQPRPCRPRTAIYLSRKGEKGEGPKRQIHNDVTEAAMEAAGVLVVRTVGKTPEQYIALAESAETLFADHGSASYNMMYWETRRMVELFPPDYWDSAFLFLADGLGIHDYHLWQIDDETTVCGLTQRIQVLMSHTAGSPS